MKNNLREIYGGFDILKFILAFFVIAIHTHPFINSNNKIILFVNQYILHFAVPCFFAIAGFLLFDKTKGKSLSESIYDIKHYVFSIFKMYVLWNIIYLPVSIYGYVQLNTPFYSAIIHYIKDAIFMGEHHLSWQLWYLLGTIYGLLLILILIKLKANEIFILIFGYSLYICSFFIEYGIATIENQPIFFQSLLKIMACTIRNGRLFTSVLFLSIGMCLARLQYFKIAELQVKIIRFLVVFILFLYHPEKTGQILLKPFLVFLLLWILIDFKTQEKYIYVILRKSSTTLYFCHMLFVFLWSIYVKQLYPEGVKCTIFTILGCCVVIVIQFSCLLLKKIINEKEC